MTVKNPNDENGHLKWFETLLSNIVEYKSEKEFEGVDFESEVVAFYCRLREFPPTDFGQKAIKL